MRSCYATMTAPGAVVDVLTVRGGAVGTEASAVAWADAVDAVGTEASAVAWADAVDAVGTEASAVAWADAVDAAVLLMQADDGPDVVVVGEVAPADALTIAASDSQPPPGVLVVRPGVIREARDA